jgi:putative Mg2+ transporter-C (MgtC) family protein
MISNTEIIVRLLLAAFLGGLVGMEREANNRPAGLRTHVLVALGSTLIMMISIDAFKGMGELGNGGEPARLAAQVVSGIGFLGAGTILRDGNNVKGLTTAASLWVCGGIGLAIGSGYYLGGFVTVAIVLFTLMRLGKIERSLLKNKYRVLIANCVERPGLIGEIGTVLGKYCMDIRDIKIIRDDEDGDSGAIKIRFIIKVPNSFPNSHLLEEILNIKSVEKVKWE